MALFGLTALGGSRGGATRTTQNQSLANTIGVAVSPTQTFGLALTNNPTIANMIGAGSTVAPASGGATLPQTVSPNVAAPVTSSANPSQSANDGGASGALPRFSPTGSFGTGAGFRPLAPAAPANDILLLLIVCGGAALLLLQE